MDDALVLSMVFTSTIAPFIISWIKDDTWPKWVRFLCAVIVSAIGGILVAYSSGELTFTERPILIVVAVITLTIAQFKLWFKDSGLEDVINPPKKKKV